MPPDLERRQWSHQWKRIAMSAVGGRIPMTEKQAGNFMMRLQESVYLHR